MMKDKSFVNIVVPVYNVADLLSRCVDSLLEQTYEDVRIVLVDDGSTDDCPAICDRYAEQDPRVTSLHRTNGGLSAARNTGIDHVFSIEEPSRGRYIAFVDSDDWVEPGYVASMLETLEASGADAAQCGHFVSYAPDNEDDKDPVHTRTTLDRAQAVESLCRNGLWDVTAWNKLYRLDLFRQIRYPEGLLYEDTATTYLITQECDRVAADMTPQYHYAQRYTSIANGTTWKDSKLDLVLAGDRMAAWVCEHYPDLKTAAAEKRAYVRLSTLSQMVNTGHHDKDLARRLRREVLSVAPTVLCDRRASKRDKLGILALLPGFWCYRANGVATTRPNETGPWPVRPEHPTRQERNNHDNSGGDHAPSSRQLRHTASGIRHAGEAEAVFRQRRSHRLSASRYVWQRLGRLLRQKQSGKGPGVPANLLAMEESVRRLPQRISEPHGKDVSQRIGFQKLQRFR